MALPRLFIALELSELQKKEVNAFQEKIKDYLDGVRWVKPEGLHLTLKFLGETEPGRIDQIKQAMDDTVSTTKKFDIIYGKSGVFPSSHKTRIVWIGLRKGDREARELAGKLDHELSRAGFEPEKRSFKPHLTIGRVRNSLSEAAAKRYLSQESSFTTAAHTIEYATLFESRLSSRGAAYSVLYKAKFPS